MNQYTKGIHVDAPDNHIHGLVDLEPGEKILLEVRRHMFVLYTKVAFIAILFFAPMFLFGLMSAGINHYIGSGGSVITGFLYAIWVLFLWILFFYYWTDYYLDVWVITNRRIFDIEQVGVFRRDVSVTRLEKVEDVTTSVRGVFATFLHFGDLHIHTAGSEIDFSIKNAANPMFVKETIMRAHGERISGEKLLHE